MKNIIHKKNIEIKVLGWRQWTDMSFKTLPFPYSSHTTQPSPGLSSAHRGNCTCLQQPRQDTHRNPAPSGKELPWCTTSAKPLLINDVSTCLSHLNNVLLVDKDLWTGVLLQHQTYKRFGPLNKTWLTLPYVTYVCKLRSFTCQYEANFDSKWQQYRSFFSFFFFKSHRSGFYCRGQSTCAATKQEAESGRSQGSV